jgi:hypothetical protein
LERIYDEYQKAIDKTDGTLGTHSNEVDFFCADTPISHFSIFGCRWHFSLLPHQRFCYSLYLPGTRSGTFIPAIE